MSKIFGTLRRNERKSANSKAPDMKGSVRIGGYTGNNHEEKNRESAQFLKFLTKDFSESKETWVSLALWKRKDEDTGEPYFSIVIEDNSWKSDSPGKAKSSGGNSFKPSSKPKPVEEEEDLWD